MSTKKLWEKGIKTDRLIEDFTVGQDRELDLLLAKHDVLGTIAHITMLESVGLLQTEELNVLTTELHKILKEVIEVGEFSIEEGVEDVHSQIELMLTRELGDIGKKVHSGRSRNDQVLVDLRLFFRDELIQIASLTQKLFNTLLGKSEAFKNVLLPGYTHTQAAMPSSFGLWFAAYAESLVDDLILMQSVLAIVNQNPLGSAAGYGSSFPLDREKTTQLLNFDHLNVNVVYAQMGRGKVEQMMAFGIAGLASTLNKLASDVCLYNSQNFGFLRLPDELTTGSSIMPHKKNPDVFELIRGKTSILKSLTGTVSSLTTNLTSGYHRDFQLLKEVLFPAIEDIRRVLMITDYSISKIDVNSDIISDSKYELIFSVERVNELVLEGVPFRDAYLKVSEEIAKGEFEVPEKVKHTHIGSIGNLGNDKIRDKMKLVFDSFETE